MSNRKPSIVLVEAYPPMQMLLDELLTREGYSVRIWPHGRSAVEYVRRAQPDLVMLDLWLQERGDGSPVLDELRQEQETQSLPLIILADDSIAVAPKRGLPVAQRLRVLEKPLVLAEVVRTVKQLLPAPIRRAVPLLQGRG